MVAADFRLNPLTVVYINRRDGRDRGLEARAFAHRRSFQPLILERDADPAFFDGVAGLVRGRLPLAAALAGLDRPRILTLWRLGLLLSAAEADARPGPAPVPPVTTLPQVLEEDGDAIDPARRARAGLPLLAALAPELAPDLPLSPGAAWGDAGPERARTTVLADRLAADGALRLDGLVARRQALALGELYGRLAASGWLINQRDKADRFILHNDPAARCLHAALTPLVAALAGRPLKPSYTFASLYGQGSDLPLHRDRSQCEITLSLLLRHQGVAADTPSPWALLAVSRRDPHPAAYHLLPGDALLFHGRELVHGRPDPLPLGDNAQLMLHYVDSGFVGSLN